MTSSMIASGSSLRGLSEVTSTRSASRARRVAHQRALAAVAVAARAEHHVQPAPRDLARRAQHVLERVGRVRVVHEHAEVLALVDRLEAAGHAAEAARSAIVARTPSERAAATAASTFCTLNRPGQRRLDLAARRPGVSHVKREPVRSNSTSRAR